MIVERKHPLLQIAYPLFVMSSYLFLYLPIIVLVLFSFNDAAVSVDWVGFSLRWYRALFASVEILDAFKVSLIVAFSSTCLSLTMGTMLVLSSKWWASLWPFNIFYTNVFLPDIIVAIGVLSVFALFQIPVGYGSLIAGHTVIGLGFVIPIVRARFTELDPILTEASLDLGATYVQTFYKVIIPLLMPSLIAAGLLTFTLSLDDFLISFFCSGPTVQTLSVYVYSMVRTGVNPTINAISTFFLVVSSLLVLLLSYFKVIDQVM